MQYKQKVKQVQMERIKVINSKEKRLSVIALIIQKNNSDLFVRRVASIKEMTCGVCEVCPVWFDELALESPPWHEGEHCP